MMIATTTEDGYKIIDFAVHEEFSIEVLRQLSTVHLDHGTIVITADNGIWRYVITNFSSDGVVEAELVSCSLR